MGHVSTAVAATPAPAPVYASKDGYARFKDKVDEYLHRAGSTQVELAVHLGLHSTAINRKMRGLRPLDHDHVRSIVTFLVERGGITGLAQLEELLRPLGLNLTLFSPVQWDSPPLAAIATVVEYGGDREGSRAGEADKEKSGTARRTTRSSGGKGGPGAGETRSANSPGSLGKWAALSGSSSSSAGTGPSSMVAPSPRPARPAPVPLHNLPAPTSAFIGRVRDRQLIRNALVGLSTGYGYAATLPSEETFAAGSPHANGEWAGTGPGSMTGIGTEPGAGEGQAQLPALVTPDGALLRLLTLTGPGGVGKTRLALELAGELVGYFRDGVYFVDLSDSRTTAAVLDKLSRVLGVKESAKEPPVDSLKARLTGREMLVVLDNFEQVLEAAGLVGELLACSNGLKIVVTSRECLHLYSEYEYAVPLLTIPDLARFGSGRAGIGTGAGSAGGKVGLAGGTGVGSSNSIISNALQEDLGRYEAVALFVQRARRFKPQFSLTPDTGPVVAEICVKLEGLALAVELAACRVKYMPVGEILTRLTDRFGLLKAQMPDKPGRHHTLRATIDWSYDLLRPGEKKLLRRLSVFRGGATLAALEAVCSGEGIASGAVVDLVGSLVDKSFVRLVDSPVGAGAGAAGAAGNSAGGGSNSDEVALEPRYMLLETIREYAWERLLSAGKGEAGRVRERHADYYLALAEEGEPKLVTGEQLVWRKRLDSEYDNIRAALEWFIGESEAEKAGRLAGALGQYWYMAGYFSEGRRWLEQVRELFEGFVIGEAVKAKALHQLARLLYEQGAWEQAEIVLKQLIDVWAKIEGEIGIRGRARSLLLLGNIFYQRDYHDQAFEAYTESANLCKQIQELYGLSVALINQANIDLLRNNLEDAINSYQESMKLQRQFGNGSGIAENLSGIARVYIKKRDYLQAWQLITESLSLCRNQLDKLSIARTLLRVGFVALKLDNFENSRNCYIEALQIVLELGSYYLLKGWYDNIAFLSIKNQRYIAAIKIISFTQVISKTKNIWFEDGDEQFHYQILDNVQQNLEPPIFEQAWVEGQALAHEDEATAGPKIVELALVALSDNSQQGIFLS